MTGFDILKIYSFSDSDRYQWIDAVNYLITNYKQFPTNMDFNTQINPEHNGFRFIKSPTGSILFGNCITPAITEQDFNNFKELNK